MIGRPKAGGKFYWWDMWENPAAAPRLQGKSIR